MENEVAHQIPPSDGVEDADDWSKNVEDAAPEEHLAASEVEASDPTPPPSEDNMEEISNFQSMQLEPKGKSKDTVPEEVEEEKEEEKKRHLNVVFIGHVDAGKSTIGGQILFLSGQVDDRTIQKYEKEAKDKSRESWYMAYIMDTNEEERVKGITVEVGRAHFETDNTRFTILDAPGHKSYVPNMISGASQADIGVLVISARKGEFETGFEKGGQTREHVQLAKTLGVSKLIVVVNKMDDPTVKWSKERFDEIESKIAPFLKSSGYNVKKDVQFLPISGLVGSNLKTRLDKSVCGWWNGPCLFDVLDSVEIPPRDPNAPLRMPIIDKYKDMGTVVMGKIESGTIQEGDGLLVMPNKAHVKVLSINSDETRVRTAGPGENVRVKLSGIEEEDILSGFVLSSAVNPIGAVFDFNRRVREMRETRAAPIVHEPKVSALGRKGLTHLQSLPRGVEVLDPLGLGIIDNKSLRVITETSDSSPVFKVKSDALDPSAREKVMYYSPNFDAKVFLSHVHHETRAADLESGALTLKTDLKGRTQQKKQLVKENFDCFVSCKTTIDDIESKMRQIEEDPEGAGTAHLHSATQKISALANRAFQPLFERQVQAEKIRSVQGMLQRFRTLFNLPSAIRGSMAKGEYALAVREYRKAKSIVLPSHVGILKRVLEEVDKVMHEFRGMLYKSMEDPQLDLADLENTVRLLLELEPDSDPVWHFLNIQNRRVRGLLEKCTSDHEAQLELLHNELQERAQSDTRWRQLQQDSNKSLDVSSSIRDSVSSDSHPIDLMGEEVDALKGRYIRRLTAVLIHHIPAFWRLALSVFSGKFAKGTVGNVLPDTEANAKPASNRNDDKSGDMKYSSHSLDEVAAMVHSTISAYEVKIHNTFRDFEESNILCPYMSDAITEITKACQTLEGKESAPPVAVKTMCALQFEISKIYILRLCSWMRTTTEELSKDEMWIPLSTLERNKSSYAISYLPLAFREMTASAMDRIDGMIQILRSEATKSEDMFDQVQEIQESVRISFLNCFLDFAGYLERIGGELTQTRSNKENTYLQNGYHNGERELPALHVGDAVVDSHKKLLIVLSNIGFCKSELSRGMYSKYKHLWLQNRDKDEEYADVRDLVTSFAALEEKILEQYTYAKSNLIRTAALNYLLDSGIQWGGAPAVKGIRDATIELLHTLVAVHAEVLSGAKPLLEKTLGILVEGLIDTFISLFRENQAKELKSLDTNGFCQLMLELEYIETVLHTYFSPDAREAFKSLQGLLLDKASECVTESVEHPGHHRRSTRGSEDAMTEERQQTASVTPDELIALAQQYSTELLEGELERTRLNIVCFMDVSLQPKSFPGTTKSAAYQSFQGSPTVSSPSFRRQQTVGFSASSRRRK